MSDVLKVALCGFGTIPEPAMRRHRLMESFRTRTEYRMQAKTRARRRGAHSPLIHKIWSD